jgi:hypothetical protein
MEFRRFFDGRAVTQDTGYVCWGITGIDDLHKPIGNFLAEFTSGNAPLMGRGREGCRKGCTGEKSNSNLEILHGLKVVSESEGCAVG